MEGKERFLFGRGEKLADHVPYKGGFDNSLPPYSLSEQVERLDSMLETLEKDFKEIPKDALADGNAVAALTLHPKYVARSGFPEYLLNAFSLRLVGSKPQKSKPDAGRGSDKEEGVASTTLYVAGELKSFSKFRKSLSGIEEGSKLSKEIVKVERLEVFRAEDRLLGEFDKEENNLE